MKYTVKKFKQIFDREYNTDFQTAFVPDWESGAALQLKDSRNTLVFPLRINLIGEITVPVSHCRDGNGLVPDGVKNAMKKMYPDRGMPTLSYFDIKADGRLDEVINAVTKQMQILVDELMQETRNKKYSEKINCIMDKLGYIAENRDDLMRRLEMIEEGYDHKTKQYRRKNM